MNAIRQLMSLGLASGLGLMAIACDTIPPAAEPEETADSTAESAQTDGSTGDSTDGSTDGSTDDSTGGSTDDSASASNRSTPSIEGSYAVTGEEVGGSTYDGTMTIRQTTGNFYTVNWQLGNQEFQGLGLLEAQSLSIGWGDPSCSVMTYQVSEQNLTDGRWFVLGQEALGTENATRTAGESTGIEGTYAVKGNNPDGSAYAGTLVVTAQDQSYQFAWQAGNTFDGVGIQQGQTVAIGWGQDNCAVAVYDVSPEGELTGLWSFGGGVALGFEAAVPIE